MAGWLTPDAVIAFANQTGKIANNDPGLVPMVDAAARWVQDHVETVNWSAVAAAEDVPADVYAGTLMLAWRWYQRRNSPLGVSGYQDYGTAPLLRHDPDIARLLGIGAEGPFRFAAAGVASTDLLPAAWIAAKDYAVSARVSLVGGGVLLAIVAGTSGATAPVAPGIGGAVTDGGVTWVRVS